MFWSWIFRGSLRMSSLPRLAGSQHKILFIAEKTGKISRKQIYFITADAGMFCTAVILQLQKQVSKVMRLDKYLSESTAHSRKDVRGLVKRGAVTVNGIAAKTSDMKIDEKNDTVCVNGNAVVYRKFIYLMMNKPQGYLSATEDDRDPVVLDLVPEEFKHFAPFPVGRLDKDTEGLLLLTNDGQFDHELMSPRKNLRKRYYAELDNPAAPEDVEAFAAGMQFKEFTAKPALLEIDAADPRKVYVEISEGKYHQVKRMCERTGKNVLFLKRVAIGNLLLDNTLECGKVRELTAAELAIFGW